MKGNPEAVCTEVIESPVGPLLAGAWREGVCLLHFLEGGREDVEKALGREFGRAVEPGSNRHLAALRKELAAYFAGKRRAFSVPLVMKGTEFQERVWKALCRIAPGSPISYSELARRVGRPKAVRAVAAANAANRICVVIPCHRVIAKGGGIGGYSGGLCRKRMLLELEGSPA